MRIIRNLQNELELKDQTIRELQEEMRKLKKQLEYIDPQSFEITEDYQTFIKILGRDVRCP